MLQLILSNVAMLFQEKIKNGSRRVTEIGLSLFECSHGMYLTRT